MMILPKTSPIAVAIPLLAMMLLTLLVGLTAYRLTDSWRQSANQVIHRATEAVLLSNIRGNLEQIETELPQQPDLARSHWLDVRQQVGLLNPSHVGMADNGELPESYSANNAVVRQLRAFTAREANISHIRPFLRANRVNISLSDLRHDLDSLGSHSSFVTLAVTGCMLLLGSVLTLITAWDLSHLMKELLRSRDLNIRLQEEERRRIASDLHDGIMQELIDLKRHYEPERLDNIVYNLRRVCQNLKPQILEDLGFHAALEALVDNLRESGIPDIRLVLDKNALSYLPPESELPLFRIIQELFSNIRKHANANQVIITLAFNPTESHYIQGTVQDNGTGFSVPTVQNTVGPRKGMGLTGIEERVKQLGGSLTIDSKPGHGSRFRLLIPTQP